ATRAKLTAPTPGPNSFQPVTDRVRVHYMRDELLVTNSGPQRSGYSYCVACGRIEPTVSLSGTLRQLHAKPYPDDKEPMCPGMVSPQVTLGTSFVSDVLLVSLQVDQPVTLVPGWLATHVALRTVSDA